MTAVFFYVQHLLGIGHVRRSALIVRALADAGADVSVVYGGFPDTAADFGAAHVIQLPPARSADIRFSAMVGETGAAIDDAWKAARADALTRAFDARPWDVLVTETYPFGRNQFRFELQPLLQRTRDLDRPTRNVASVRDILVAKSDAGRRRRMVDTAARWYDLVLVHGDPDILPLTATLPEAAELGGRLQYTGYVTPSADGPEPPEHEGHGDVVVSVGGGAAGASLLAAAMAAQRSGAVPERHWRLLCGPDTPRDLVDRLHAESGDGVTVEPARPDFAGLLRRCAVSVSQAGYNTVMDLLAAGCRSVLVPFSAGGETEQSLRADLLAARGLATVVPEQDLTPATLVAAVNQALEGSAPPPLTYRHDGAAESARWIMAAGAEDGGRFPSSAAPL